MSLPKVSFPNVVSVEHFNSKATMSSEYSFPLRQFKPRSPNLLVLPCSKKRPYSKSQSHKRVKKYLSDAGFEEGRDYDRITLSGLYGPVHWKDETLPTIMSYDFQLSNFTSKEHLDHISFKLGSVLNVVRKRYKAFVGFLLPKPYLETFGPIINSFNGVLVNNVQSIVPHFDSHLAI